MHIKNIMIALVMLISQFGAIASAVNKDQTQLLVRALIKVESGGNDNAVGDRHMKEKAYGPLQVRQPCADDVNRRYGTKIQAKDLLGDRAKSEWVCQKYIEMYATHARIGRAPTIEDKARIWNGGPNGWKQSSTQGYWSKVKKHMGLKK